jgi:prepilin-type N-terminal cleavage/methylation domain-containing protein/prepilin-type processing-associated H-X9-DG protein
MWPAARDGCREQYHFSVRSRKRLVMRWHSRIRAPLRDAVTLIELLAVVAIIGVLVALVLPAAQAAREASRRAECQNNLRQIGVALHEYHGAHGQFPVGCLDKRIPKTNPNGRQLAWSAMILQELEEPALAKRIDFNSAYDSSANSTFAGTIISTYLCPTTVRRATGREGAIVADPTVGGGTSGYRGAATDYGGIYGAAGLSPAPNGVFLYERAVKISEITDGTSHTLALAEDTGRGWLMDGEWINGENIYDVGNLINTQQHNEIWSDHPGGAMALWCDGSASLLEASMEMAALRAICTRAGND